MRYTYIDKLMMDGGWIWLHGCCNWCGVDAETDIGNNYVCVLVLSVHSEKVQLLIVYYCTTSMSHKPIYQSLTK